MAEMNIQKPPQTCKTCKHFSYKSDTWGECLSEKFDATTKVPGKHLLTTHGVDEGDVIDIQRSFRINENFGCIFYEVREPDTSMVPDDLTLDNLINKKNEPALNMSPEEYEGLQIIQGTVNDLESSTEPIGELTQQWLVDAKKLLERRGFKSKEQ